jgi:hypothetical protein
MKVLARANRELVLINARNTQNENIVETIELEVPEKFEDFNKKIVFVTDDGIFWDLFQNNEYRLQKAITKYKKVQFYIWLTKDDEDWRSQTKQLIFYDNEDASGEITPEEISGVNTVINLLEDEISKVERLDITAEKVGKVTTLTITDKDGTQTSYEILDGEDGQDGDDYVITPEDYQAIANIVLQTISVPTKTSDLTNDSGFIDNTVNNLTNYYNKNQTYNKDEIDGKLASIYRYKGTVATYSDLPSTGLTIGDVYNVEEDGSNYAWNGTIWDKLGGDVDLSGYYNKTQTDELLSGKVNNSQLNDYYTKTRTDELLGTKQNTISSNNKLASDLVDDTNQTNKFVTSAEKTQITTNQTDISNIKDGTTLDSFGDVETALNSKLDTSKVKTTTDTTQGNVYDVTYINTMIGDLENILETLDVGGGVQ